MAHQRRHAVVAQPSRVESGGDEGRAEGVHLHQRRELRGVAEVVRIPPAGEGGARGRLHRHHPQVAPAAQLLPDERKRDAGEVAAAAGAADDHVGVVVRQLELRQRLAPDHALVHQHVVEHAAERVLRVVAGGRILHRLADGDAEAPGAVRMLGEHRAPGVGVLAGARDAGRAVGLHHRLAVGLLVEAHPHHVHLHLQPEERRRVGQRRAPLPGPGLRRQTRDPRFLVVERLGDGGVGLVAAGGAHPLVLVVDARGGIEGLLQPAGAVERGRAPRAVRLAHRRRDLDLALGRHLLPDQRHRKERREVVGTDRLEGAGMQHRRGRAGQIRLEVVPGGGNRVLVEQILGGSGHLEGFRLVEGIPLGRGARF